MGGQSDGTIVLWFLAAGFLVTALVFPAMLAWYINRLSPEAISRRLLNGCPAIRRPTKWLRPAWDPSQPRGRGMWTEDGPGMATYTLTPDRLVRLELVRDDGRREEHLGPPLSRRTASAWDALIWLPPLAYLSSAIIGALGGIRSSMARRNSDGGARRSGSCWRSWRRTSCSPSSDAYYERDVWSRRRSPNCYSVRIRREPL